MSRLRLVGALLLTSVALTGCVTATQQRSADRSARSRLTQAELVSANTDNVYDAVNKLRPEWLTSRGPTSVTDATPTSVNVFMDGSMLGNADFLKQVAILTISEVRYWEPGQASARFGMGNPRGVLELIRR